MLKYNACNFFVTRTPILSVNDYLNIFSDPALLNTNLQNAFNDPVLQEALLVASKDLYLAHGKNDITAQSKSAEQIRSSLIKYFIRLSTRPTPFGLFSGISIGRFGSVSGITVASPQHHTKRARPDMEWVYGVIKKIESDKKIRAALPVRFNDFTYPNGSRIEKPNKTFMQLEEGNELSSSIRYTAQVKMLEQQCAGYTVFSGILDSIVQQNPNVPVNKIETFLSQLLENEFLLSRLRPPLINTDALDYLLGILGEIQGIEEVDFYISKLRQIQNSISAYNGTSIGNGIDIYNDTIQLQKELFECKNYLQVDMKAHTHSNSLGLSLKTDLERFASAMYKLAPTSKVSDEMAHYIGLFQERYGSDAAVPVLELLDIDKGLGSPAHFNVNTVNRPVPKRPKPVKEERLKTLLQRKLIFSLRSGSNTIEITDRDIDYVCDGETQSDEHHTMDALQSFELYLLAHPGADYRFTVAPAIASDGFGKSFGRFSDMLTTEERMLLEEGYTKQKDMLQEYVIAEISELPSRGRTSNVTSNNSSYNYQIPLTTNPCDGKHVLSIRDLYIGIEHGDNQFYIKSKSLDKKVVVTMTCMMNPTFGSSALRFLREVSGTRKTNIIDGILGTMDTNFEYCPRIVYDKVIIRPETWVVTKDAAGEENFLAYRKQWGLPRHVFLNEFDNRLMLDLDNLRHRSEIYSILKKNTTVSVALTELGCNFDDFAATNAKGERYVTEIVVPFVLAGDNKKSSTANADVFTTLSDISANRMKIDREQLMLLPGNNEWLYYKLYGCSKRQNELISAAHATLQQLVAEGLAQKYFFIRYADPEPHLRLRIRPGKGGVPALFAHTSEWFKNLYADGLISKAVSDSYIRESERYGGPGLIEHAEDYFYNDSKLVMALLNIQRYGDTRFNMDFVGVSFIISALEAFGLSIEEQAQLLDSLSSNKSYRKDFQNNRKTFMHAADSSDGWFSIRSSIPKPEIYDLISTNSKALEQYAQAVYDADKRGKLTNSVQRIVLSTIHMFCNRLVGNNAWEQKIYALAKHGVHGLKGMLKNRQKEFAALELPDSLL